MKRLYTATAGVLLLCSTALAFNFDFSFRFGNKNGAQYIDLAPGLEWSTNAYEFGSHDVGTTTNHIFTLTNNGTDTAEDVTVSTSLPFRIYSSTVFGNISASRARTVKIQYKPTVAGAHAAMLNYSAPNISPVGVALTGTGVAPVGGPVVDDNFVTDTLASYTQLATTYSMVYDVANARVKGGAAGQRPGIYYNTPMPAGPYYVQAKLFASSVSGSTTTTLVFNCNGSGAASTGYRVRPSSTYFYLEKFVNGTNGTRTDITGTYWTWPAGSWADNTSHLARVEVSGTTFHAYVDWNDNGSFGDAGEDLGVKSDASYSGLYVGLSTYGTTAWADDFKAGALP